MGAGISRRAGKITSEPQAERFITGGEPRDALSVMSGLFSSKPCRNPPLQESIFNCYIRGSKSVLRGLRTQKRRVWVNRWLSGIFIPSFLRTGFFVVLDLRCLRRQRKYFCPITRSRNSKRKDGNYVSESLNGFEFCGS